MAVRPSDLHCWSRGRKGLAHSRLGRSECQCKELLLPGMQPALSNAAAGICISYDAWPSMAAETEHARAQYVAVLTQCLGTKARRAAATRRSRTCKRNAESTRAAPGGHGSIPGRVHAHDDPGRAMPVHRRQVLLQPGKLLRVCPVLHVAAQHQHMRSRHLAARSGARERRGVYIMQIAAQHQHVRARNLAARPKAHGRRQVSSVNPGCGCQDKGLPAGCNAQDRGHCAAAAQHMQSDCVLLGCAGGVDQVKDCLSVPRTSSKRARTTCSPLMGTRSTSHTPGSLSSHS